MKRNRFTRALHHLNKKHVVESAPTNNTTGVFSVTPSGVGPVGWTDRTFTTDISGNPLPKAEVADFTVGENPENSTEAQDTSGLFEDDGVTVKTLTPPGDNSYILGPFSSMWYAWGNFTTLGYIRQSDRRMVNLGTITGKLSDWDGSSINSYGQLTLEQALWFRDVDKFGGINNDPANHNYRAFYPGPPSTSRDAFGRYLCVIAASREAGGEETRPAPPETATQPGEMDSDDNFSSIFDRISRGAQNFGSAIKSGIDSTVNFYSNLTGSRLGQYAAMIGARSTLGIMDNILYGRSGYLLKGVGAGRKFNPSFIGGAPGGIIGKITGGKKLVDWGDSLINGSINNISRSIGGPANFAPNVIQKMVGKNYKGQWFTDPTRVNVATGYARKLGPGGTAALVPRTAGKFGWKNWLGSNTSRSLAMQPETFQRTDDILNVMEGTAKSIKKFGPNALRKGGARINLDIDNPQTQKLLRRYAAKVATNSKTLKYIARGIPVLGAGISAADAAYRFSQGDWKGGVLSIASMVPGPVGYFALGAQVSVDTGALEKAIEFGVNRQMGFDPTKPVGDQFSPRTMGSSADRRRFRGGGERNDSGQVVTVTPPAKPSGNTETAKIDLEISKIKTKMSGNVSQYEKNRLNQQLSRAKQRLEKAQANLDTQHERNVQDWDRRRSARGSGYKPPKSNEGDLPGDSAPGADVPAVNTSREKDGRVEYNRGLRTDSNGQEYYEILTYPKGGSLYSGGAYTYRSYKSSGKPPVKDSSDPGMPSNPDFRGPGNNKDFKPEPKKPEKDYERNRRRNRPKSQFNDYVLDGDFLMEERQEQEQYTSANMDELKDELRKAGVPIDDPEEMADQFALASLAAGMNPQIVEIIQLAIVGAKLTPQQQKDISSSMLEFGGMMYANEKAEQIYGKNTNELEDKNIDSTQDTVNEVRILSESRKRHVIREIKKPITLPETKKKFKVKPKVLGHPSNKTLSDQMKDTTPNVAFKKEIPVWSMDQKIRNARSSQDKKNEVLEYLGSSGDHWEYMTKTIKEHNKKIINLNYGGKKNKVTRKEQVDKDTLIFFEDEDGNKSNVLQSKLNEMQAEAGDKEMFAKYYEMNPEKKSLFKEVVKRGVFDYPKKPSKKGYPDKEPEKLDPTTGMHPKYGKKYKYDKLDPQSAESMPMQGNPEIDANITKNLNPESKKRKSKILNQPNG